MISILDFLKKSTPASLRGDHADDTSDSNREVGHTCVLFREEPTVLKVRLNDRA